MRTHNLLALFIVFPLWANSPMISQTSTSMSSEDFDHQNKGCPENSECDVVMGHQMNNWRTLIKGIGDDIGPAKIQSLENFRSNTGIPVEFYTHQKSEQGFRPIFFNSSCKDHNPKNPQDKTLRGIAFVKALNKKRAVIWKDQTQHEVPVGELFIPQPITAFYPDGAITYYAPLEDQPLFIKDKSLHILREDDGVFFILRISPEGVWSIVNVDLTQLSIWENRREQVQCPEDKSVTPKEFGVTFCKTVWDEDAKKIVVVKLHEGCVK